MFGFGVQKSSSWPPQWYNGVCDIAARSPLLLGQEHLRSELLYNWALKRDAVDAVSPCLYCCSRVFLKENCTLKSSLSYLKEHLK